LSIAIGFDSDLCRTAKTASNNRMYLKALRAAGDPVAVKTATGSPFPTRGTMQGKNLGGGKEDR